ncbi:ABC transporter ATP-binding protein [Sporolactobacillus vineae]|uniref:ABC transporter ATP-binding protein n=1 Tax=Sporolactobacillus vineae TaxID=444463 RepID=UPI0002886FDD|nr:ABC transporter ATP-binding protein [Sporolactobacillus vineae]
MDSILQLHHVSVSAKVGNEKFEVVKDVSFHVGKGETLGIVGESGCGKSITAKSIIGLLPSNAWLSGGDIILNNREISSLKKRDMRKIQGKEIAMIFQEPMASLDPVYTISEQLAEMIKNHLKLTRSEIKNYSIDLLEKVGIPRAKEILNEFPFQLSGGMSQRIMIAMAMSCKPEILIADEPTTALDVTIQAQIMDLMGDLKNENQTSVILITHDMGIVAEFCQRVIVMYAGEIVEEATVEQIFNDPKHPYTQALLKSIPRIDERQESLPYIEGSVPSPRSMPKGCRFADRCPLAFDQCFDQEPDLISINNQYKVRCWLYEKSNRKG